MNAIVTGATKGIGKAIAQKLAAKGYNLAICARSEADLKAVTDELIAAHSIKVYYQATDLSQKAEVLAFAKLCLAKMDSIDVVVNNAGWFGVGLVANEPEGQLEQMMATNVYSVYHLVRAVLPTLVAQKSGHIFNICSVASVHAFDNCASYNMSKFALLGFSKSLRKETLDKGIKVVSVMPGATYTNAWDGVEIDPNRIMNPNNVAQAVVGILDIGEGAVVEELVMRPQLGDL